MVAAAAGVLALLPGMPIMPVRRHRRRRRLRWPGKRAQAAKTAAGVEIEVDAAGRARRRRADRRRPGHRRRQDRAGLRPAAADQRPGGPPPDRPDPGAAPHAGRRVRLRHAAGAHPRQHAPADPGLRHPHQGDGGRRGRGAPRLADGHGPARRPGRAARRAHRASRPSACPPPGSTRACARRPPSAATPSSIRPRC